MDEDDENGARQGFLRRLEHRHGLSAMVALATFAALVVGVLAAVPDWREMLGGDDDPPARAEQVVPPSPAPRLGTIDLVVRDPELTGDPSDPDTGLTPPVVEITVHNRGERRSVVTRVVVTVEDSAVMELCAAQGEPNKISATYDVRLPLRPAVGTVIRAPVSQQQGADEADRFALRFATPPRRSPTTVHLYRLRFELEAGPVGRLPAGTAVVAIPLSPGDGGGYFWGVLYDSGEVVVDPYPGLDDDIACMKDNSATLKRIVADGAELSPEIAEAKADLRL